MKITQPDASWNIPREYSGLISQRIPVSVTRPAFAAIAIGITATNKTARIHNLLDEFTRLSDDLQDNMDQYDEQHADLRKVLKDIITKTDEWAKVLTEPKPSAQYDFVRKTAIDSNQSAHEAAVQMLADEEKYIAEKKKEEKERQKEEQKR